MSSREEIENRVTSRSVPLPEEAAAEHGGEDRRAEADSILGESEERVAAASATARPSDAADEHRRSAETAR
ncbi:MAG TPA: hypothetical protein VFE65_00345 [Pseudonocardia sp.]|jgi:hypothetical protein|nr:hypothetical protein [Pseudonocardia sp.]